MISNLKSEKENQEYLKSVIGINKRNGIDWNNSVGKEIEYEYDGVNEYSKGVLKIDKYENRHIYFEGYEKGIYTGVLTKCGLGSVLDFISSEFKHEIGDTINCLTIIDREYKKDKRNKNWKYYKYKCNKCGNVDWISEYVLKRGQGCNACCNPPRKAVLGINTIWDKARWMVDLGVDIEDAKTHMPSSTEEIYVVCPDCRRIKKIIPDKIHQSHSIGCSCGDGVSYPEKLTESLLIQLELKYIRQYKPDWSQNKRYDFYLLDTNTIIEVHGGQHYEEKNSFTRKTLKDEQENDKMKEELALSNGVSHYIVIDCSVSDLEYIRLNILDSELNELFDLSNINWTQCEEYALKNKVREVCSYYKEHPGVFVSDLAKEFSMGSSTIKEYLKRGTKIGWCEYDSKEEMRRNGRLKGKSNIKSVSQYSLEGKFIKTYPSVRKAERQTGINNTSISACCNGKRKTAGGYIWKHVK